MSDLSALEAARSLLNDVEILLSHHPATEDPRRGRPAGPSYGPLLRASTALCYTAWEVYVEEALVETVDWLVANRSPREFPKALREWIVANIADPWDLVDAAWHDKVHDAVRDRVDGDDEGRFGFNTANVSNVESLYQELFGVSPLREVSWQGKANREVRKDVARLVKIRGQIVHRGSTPGTLDLAGAKAWASFVRRLIEKFDDRLAVFREGVPLA